MRNYSKVFKGAGMLAIFSVLAKIVGALYRIPLTNIIGTEGIGLYQMVFPLYTVLLTISSGGLPSAISKVVSGLNAKNDERGARRVLAVSIISLLIVAATAAVFLIMFRELIANLQGNSKASIAYIGIAPSLIFVAVIACFRGFYQGRHNMFPSAISQLIEQIFKLAAGLTLARLFLPLGTEYAVFGAVLGVSLSEFAAMLLLIIQFFFTDRSYRRRHIYSYNRLRAAMEAGEEIIIPKNYVKESRGNVLKSIYQIAIPVTLGSLVLPLTQVVDSVLVINLLISTGAERTDATRLFGIINGPIASVVNLPVVVTLSIAIVLLPSISEAMAGKRHDISAMVGQSIKYGMFIGLPCAFIFAFFAPEILSILYSRALSEAQINIGTILLRVESLTVVYVSLLQIATAVLQGMGRAHLPAVNLLAGAASKILFTVILLPRIGIVGAVIATVLCYAITCYLDVRSMRKFTEVSISPYKFLFSPLICCMVMTAVIFGSQKLFALFMPSALFAFVAALLIGGMCYIIMAFLTKCITKGEIVGLIRK